MKKMLLNFLITSSLLSACSLSPVKVDPGTSYLINTSPSSVPVKRTEQAGNLLVTRPECDAVYNTTQMAYTNKPYQLGYYVKNRWAETPPQMLQPLIIETMQKTHHFHSVGSASASTTYDYVLNTQILTLKQDYTRRPHAAELKIHAELVNAKTNAVLGSKDFYVTEPLAQDNPYAGVAAINKATSSVLRQMATFVLRHTCSEG